MSGPRLTREQAAVIGAYTGYAIGPFGDVHGYAEQVLGRPVWTHEFAGKPFMDKLQEAAKADFVALAFVPAEGDVPADAPVQA